MHTFGWKQIFLQIIFFVIFFTTLKDADVLELTTRIKRPKIYLLVIIFSTQFTLFFILFFHWMVHIIFIKSSSTYSDLIPVTVHLNTYIYCGLIGVSNAGRRIFALSMTIFRFTYKMRKCMYSKFVMKLLQICVTYFASISIPFKFNP